MEERVVSKNQKKFQWAKRLSSYTSSSRPSFSVSLSIHGVHTRWTVFDREIYQKLCARFPSSWFLSSQHFVDVEINWFQPRDLGIEESLWEDADANCRFLNEGIEKYTIQRDFICAQKKSSVFLASEYLIDDGFNNFLRFLLPRFFLKQKKLLLHSSAVVNSEERAYLSLGASGAGKTTISSFMSAEQVLGDDMNLLEFRDGNWWVTPALVGQVFQASSKINHSFPVENFFVLKKNKKNEIVRISKKQAYLSLISSVANLFWEQMSSEEILQVQEMINSMIETTPCKELAFNLDGDVWEYIENQKKEKNSEFRDEIRSSEKLGLANH